MRRVLAIFFVLTGCVGQNPYWDGSGEAEPSHGVPAEDGNSATDADASEENSGDSMSSLDGDADEGATSMESEEGQDDSAVDTSGDDDASSCESGFALCAGECTDIASDKHACGTDCVDCTDVFENKARCVDGQCMPREE